MNSGNMKEDRLELLKNAIHSVRSPASTIWDLAETILATKQIALDGQTRTDIVQIQESAQRVLTAIDAIGMLLRVEILPLQLTSMDISSVVEEAIRRFETSQNRNGQCITINTSPQLPLVDLAPEFIAQATFLLLSQHSHHAPRGAEINLAITTSDGYVTVNIGAEHTVDVPNDGVLDLELLTVDRIMSLHQGRLWINKYADKIVEYEYSLSIVATQQSTKEASR